MLTIVLECTMGTIDMNNLLGNWIVQRVKKNHYYTLKTNVFWGYLKLFITQFEDFKIEVFIVLVPLF
jgi:hypothetical protein